MWNHIRRIDSSNENVSKYVFEKHNAVAEAVLYKYPTYNERTVICCSTQSGCPVGCRFCGAGDSFVRSLSCDEIVSQTVHMIEDRGIVAADVGRMQIMFMSMGEPLLNQKSLISALHELYKLYPKAALLISTIGPRVFYGNIERVSVEIPTIGLQFSVHESSDAARDKLIPFASKLTLREIAARGAAWLKTTGRHPFFNYCAHEGNTGADDVSRLLRLFDPLVWRATVSVVCERDEHVAAANARQRQLAGDFANSLVAAGYDTRTFDPAGQDDIGGGCGQLWFVQEWMRKHSAIASPTVGHSLPIVHAPRAT